MAHDHSHEHGHGHCSGSHGNKDKDITLKDATAMTEKKNDHHNSNGSNNNNNNNNEAKVVLCRLYIAMALCGTFLIVEVTGGILSSSLAILSDAAHLLADMCSFAVAIIAAHLASMPSSEFHTYGLKRAESLAALLSMVSLALVSIGLAWEAIRRLFFLAEPNEVNGQLMSTVAAIGVGVNVVLALVLGEHHTHMPGSDHHGCSSHGGDHGGHDHSGHDHSGHGDHQKKDKQHHDIAVANGSSDGSSGCCGGHGRNDHGGHDHGHNDHHVVTKFLPPPVVANEQTSLLVQHHHDNEVQVITTETSLQQKQKNINLHAAYLHVMGDLAQSAAVLIAGLIIYFQPTWHIVDPICTLLFCTMVFASTLPVIRSSVAVLIEEVPPNVNWKLVHDAIENVTNVSGVHDLHIWSISHGIPGLSVHCFVHGSDAIIQQQALRDIHQVCIQYGISHVTIQAQLITTTTTLSSPTASTVTNKETNMSDNNMVGDCITCNAEDLSCCVQRSQIV